MSTADLPAASLNPPASLAGAPRRLPAVSRLIAAFGLLALVAAWVLTAVFLATQRTEAIESRARENLSLARALEETTVRVLSAMDHATLRVSQAVRSGQYQPGQIVQFASETGLVPAILVQLSLIDADGRFAGSNLDPDGARTGHVDLSEREHVRVHLQPNKIDAAARRQLADGLFIGKPVLGKVSGRWTIQLSRRIVADDGRSLGVVVASLDPGYFETMYRSVDLGPQGTVSLVGSDMTVRARVDSGRSAGMGQRVGPSSPLAADNPPERGHYTANSGIDGVERVFAYHRAAGFPLYVFVGTATAQALADWSALRSTALALMAVLTVVSGLALWSFTSSVRRLEAHNRELAASEARAQAANQAKTEFLAAISHELRTPLTSIRGFAELMERRLQEERYRESASMIRRSAEHLNELLTEILDFAKVEAGAMPIHATAVALRPLVADTAGFFQITAAEKGLALKVDLADDLPETLVVDGLRLKQVLNNLLSNALKFTQHGSVGIVGRRAGDAITLEVTDTGPGIPPELHDTVFERFRQANAQVANDHGGTGLGLALSRALAELMGGTLTLQSKPGEGATFRLTLPQRR